MKKFRKVFTILKQTSIICYKKKIQIKTKTVGTNVSVDLLHLQPPCSYIDQTSGYEQRTLKVIPKVRILQSM